MASYSIPSKFLPGFEIIHNLREDQFDAVIKVLDQLSVGDGPRRLASMLDEERQLIEIDNYQVSRTIFSMVSLTQDDTSENVSIELSKSFSRSSELANKDNPTEILDRLRMIIDRSSKLSLSIKALQIRSQYKNILQDSKIVTDIRVVFEDDLNLDQKNAIIVHNLNLEYVADKERRDLYFALDKSDLVKLKETVERAIAKEESIRNSKGINYINVND